MALEIEILVFSSLFVAEFLAMWLASKVLKFKKQNLLPALLVAALYSIVSDTLLILAGSRHYAHSILEIELFDWGVLIIQVLVGVLAIKQFYKEGWKKTIGASIIAWIIMLIVVRLITLLLWGPSGLPPGFVYY